MKRQILLFTLCLAFAASGFAQGTTSMTSKNGHEILPQEGDWCLGMDAVPVLDFALNVVNIGADTQHYSQHPGYVSGFNNTVMGKYFTSATQAYRARVQINTNRSSTTSFFDDPLDNSADPGEVEDKARSSQSSIVLGAGIENRRGHNRVQGFYGAEGWLGLAGSGTNNEYGVEWNQAAEDAGAVTEGETRVLSSRTGATVGVGVRGFGGIEYFPAPKVSIGAEFGIGAGVQLSGRGSTEVETYTDGATETNETKGSSSTNLIGIGMDTGVNTAGGLLSGGSAALYILFHI